MNTHLHTYTYTCTCAYAYIYTSTYIGHVQGGVIMKLMDSAAGVSAVRFCKSNVVTASLGALNFKKPIFVGNVVTVSAWPSYTSQKTIEVS